MGNNSFGKAFQITTWGESHGKSIGVVIDGCPANLPLTEEEIFNELKRRRPGYHCTVSTRKEEDRPIILSGVFEGKTTGAPIHILIENIDVKEEDYLLLKELYRPSHGQFTYHKKYGHYDYRGSGRFSGRETANWVAAGAVAKKLLQLAGIETCAYLQKVGQMETSIEKTELASLRERVYQDPVFCPDQKLSKQIQSELLEMIQNKDSIGGVVGFIIIHPPVGLGEPIFEKLEAKLAHGMMTIPGSRGFEIGEGFFLSSQKGSQVNDPFVIKDQTIRMETNHSGGVLAGISTGEPIYGRVAFKPTPTIKQKQKSVDIHGKEITCSISDEARHDPCIAIRAVPVVDAMCSLVMADLFLMNRLCKVDG